jgi:hypothetical protein
MDPSLQSIIVAKLLKRFPAFYANQKFITMFTRACYWSISWGTFIQPTLSHPISLCTFPVAQVIPKNLSKSEAPCKISEHADFFWWGFFSLPPPPQLSIWRTTPCQLSKAAYTIHPHVPSISSTCNLRRCHVMVTRDLFNMGELSTTNNKVDHWAFRLHYITLD